MSYDYADEMDAYRNDSYYSDEPRDLAPLRDLVETGGHPFIKLVILPDDSVEVTAVGVDQQNVLPLLAMIVRHAAQVDPVPG